MGKPITFSKEFVKETYLKASQFDGANTFYVKVEFLLNDELYLRGGNVTMTGLTS